MKSENRHFRKRSKRKFSLYKTITAGAPSHASYYPGAEKIVIKLVYHPETKEILGVQMIGKEGVAKESMYLRQLLLAASQQMK